MPVSSCPKCFVTVTAYHKFCAQCGTDLSKLPVCSSCKSEVSLGDKFCGSCGVQLSTTGESIPESSTRLRDVQQNSYTIPSRNPRRYRPRTNSRVINKNRNRNWFTFRKFALGIFILFNLFMLAWTFSACGGITSSDTTEVVASGLAGFVVIILWVMGDIILGIILWAIKMFSRD